LTQRLVNAIERAGGDRNIPPGGASGLATEGGPGRVTGPEVETGQPLRSQGNSSRPISSYRNGTQVQPFIGTKPNPNNLAPSYLHAKIPVRTNVYQTTFDDAAVGYYEQRILLEAKKWYADQQKALAQQQQALQSQGISDPELARMQKESQQLIAENQRLIEQNNRVLKQLEQDEQRRKSLAEKKRAKATTKPTAPSKPQPQTSPGAEPLNLESQTVVQVPQEQSLNGFI
jgi:hypothetical protein